MFVVDKTEYYSISDKEPMNLYAIAFKPFVKSIDLGIKYLSCKATVCLHLVMILWFTFCMCVML